jgi:hypothetical protein
MKKIFILILPSILAIGCSKDDAINDIDLSSITGSYHIGSLTATSGGLCFPELNLLFYKDCVTADGNEYCRMGQLIISPDSTVSSTINMTGFPYNFIYPTGQVSISGNVATICLDNGNCDEFDIEEDGLYLYYRYKTLFGCKVSIGLNKG